MKENDQAAVDLEREKWQAELELRRRELDLKEREQRNRDAEIELRRKEQASSAWRSPLTVAVFAAAIAAAGNAVVTVVNGNLQRELERNKREAELVLERSKAESDRILEMIKTGDTEKAAGNLEFLLQSGLVTDAALTEKLSWFLKQRTPGSGPSLPASAARVGFEQSDSLTPSLQANLQSLLDSYFVYLDKVGFPPAQTKVTVKIEANQIGNAYYVGRTNTIVIGRELANDPSVALREYNHHILTLNNKGYERKGTTALESGLADYFACSFLKNPNIGEEAVKAFDRNRPYLRTLSNKRTYNEFKDIDEYQLPYIGAEIWGGAFWEIREQLGRDTADAMIATAWLQFERPGLDTREGPEFVKILLARAKERGRTPFTAVQTILRERMFPIHP